MQTPIDQTGQPNTTEELPMIHLGEIRIAPLGVGVWAWGDKGFWGYGTDYGRSDVEAAYQSSIDAGLRLFDTAELYGRGESERILGEIVRAHGGDPVIASKFAPFPWRLSAKELRTALDKSLERLGMPSIDLYQIHWPYTLLSIQSLMDALADAVAEGKIRYAGVSNYSADQMRRAHEALARRGVPLVSNQVEYSLLKRKPETNGVMAACRDLQVVLIAYSPLAQGLLTGKYTPDNLPSGFRRFSGGFNKGNVRAALSVAEILRMIGENYGKTPGQVALNWLARQPGVLPIPGAKNARQATQNAGALGWRLSDDDAAAIDRATAGWKG